jgi:hypothetical protein
MKKLLTLFLTLLLITTNAYAEWIFYGKDVNDTVLFYDNSTLKRNGDKVKVWSYFNISPNDKEAKSRNVASARGLNEIDCVNETIKILSARSYTKPNLQDEINGETNLNSNPTTYYISPDSAHAILMKLVCKK